MTGKSYLINQRRNIYILKTSKNTLPIYGTTHLSPSKGFINEIFSYPTGFQRAPHSLFWCLIWKLHKTSLDRAGMLANEKL